GDFLRGQRVAQPQSIELGYLGHRGLPCKNVAAGPARYGNEDPVATMATPSRLVRVGTKGASGVLVRPRLPRKNAQHRLPRGGGRRPAGARLGINSPRSEPRESHE